MGRSLVAATLLLAFVMVAGACAAEAEPTQAAPVSAFAHAERLCGVLSSGVVAPDSPAGEIRLLPLDGNVVLAHPRGPSWSLVDAIDPPPKPSI